MKRSLVAAIAVLHLGCATWQDSEADDPPSERLKIVRTDERGDYVWYDAERGEECKAYETESNGTRCFPLFTSIGWDQLGYRDAECRGLVAWTTLERADDRYVAIRSPNDPDIILALFRVMRTGEDSARYYRASAECVPDKTGEAGPCADITTRIHPREFAPVNACGVGFVETRLSGQSGPELVLCRACDHDCDTGGDPCRRFGDACDFLGKPGVCSTCCNGFTGELRCYPADY